MQRISSRALTVTKFAIGQLVETNADYDRCLRSLPPVFGIVVAITQDNECGYHNERYWVEDPQSLDRVAISGRWLQEADNSGW
jgi:hypothetical protein